MDQFSFGKRGLSVQRLAVLVMLCTICKTAPVYSQPGFLSIDCGSRTNYTDPTTGIFWETDEPYISTGSSVNNLIVANPEDQLNPGQLNSLRLFNDPGRRRDCYVLPTEPEQLYLIRSTFYYGNLTNAASAPSSFSLYLNGMYWFSVQYIQGDYSTSYSGGVVYSLGKVLNFCIIRQAGSTSFISSLELRRLDNGMYSAARTPLGNRPQFLDALIRENWGASDDSPWLRYPDDKFDRIWSRTTGNATQSRNSTVTASSSSARAPDQPPVKVMEDAIMSYGSHYISSVTTFYSPLGNVLVCVYCQDLDGNATAENVRGMDFYINGHFKQSFNSSSEVIEVFGTGLDILGTTLNVTLQQTSWSKLPPVGNALEAYTLRDYNISQTAVDEAQAISALQTAAGLTDWDGDPCVPVPYDWISCVVDNNDDTLYRINSLSLNGRNISGSIPNQIFDFKKLTILSLDSNNITGAIPNFSRLGLLQTLSIRDNKLNGDIRSLSSLVHLQNLNLENNVLNGSVPDFLSSFRNLTNLHLDNNRFTGDVPASLSSNGNLNFTFASNPGLRSKASSSGGSKKSNVRAIVGGLLAGIVGLILAGLIVWHYSTRKKRAESRILKAIRKARNDDKPKNNAATRAARAGRDGSAYGSLGIFSLKDVSDATKKFSRQIGQGAFGPVYYGKLPNGEEIAAKVKSGVSRQGETEFLNELELLSRIHHGNLVSLIGFCEEAGQEILIYAFLPNGSLRDHLYGNRSKTPLDWRTRLSVAVSSATGLEYLHFHCNPRIIHRDVKSSNILLDKNMVGKVADFGISKETLEGMTTGVDTLLKGTPGYIDPEYFISQRLTQKSDVFSFGVLLLEIISGLHPHPTPLEDGTTRTLVEWVRKSEGEGNASDVFDPAMRNNFSYQSARMVLDLALDCTNPVGSLRPDMRQVLHALNQASHLEEVENAKESPKVGSEKDDIKLIVSRSDSQDRQYSRNDFSIQSDPSPVVISYSEDATIVEPR